MYAEIISYSVIDDESLPRFSRLVEFEAQLIPEWPYDLFNNWMFSSFWRYAVTGRRIRCRAEQVGEVVGYPQPIDLSCHLVNLAISEALDLWGRNMSTGLKESEIRRHHLSCSVCRRKLGQTETPFFYRIIVDRWGLNLDAISRHQGLTMMLGGLAAVMGTDEDMATRLMSPTTLTICETCSHENSVCMLALSLATEET